jgi:DNA-binding NarL/FixJ family response regulator
VHRRDSTAPAGAYARELVISDLTAKTHVSRILTKLDLSSRGHAVVFACETGPIIPGTDP